MTPALIVLLIAVNGWYWREWCGMTAAERAEDRRQGTIWALAGAVVLVALGACSPTLQGPPPDLYAHRDWTYVATPPKTTPGEARANLAAYYGAVWFAHCQGKPTVNATPGCQTLMRNGTLPWVAERDFCCLREP